MSTFVVIILMLLNFGISWWNASAVGSAWTDAKAAGGWIRALAWCGAVMAACGFSWVFLIILTFITKAAGWLPEHYALAAMQIGYLILIVPIIGAGLGIWADSVATAWRERTFASTGIAVWNSYAQFSNMRDAFRAVPSILDSLGDLFDRDSSKSSDDDEEGGFLWLIVFAIVAAAILGGVFLTWHIVRTRSARRGQEIHAWFRDRRAEAAAA